MRVLLLNYEFPPLGGGAATASAQIAAHMAARGVEVAVLTSHMKGLPRKERKDGYTIYRVPVMRKRMDRCSLPEMGVFIAGAIIPALRLARRFKPDVMHVFFGMPTGPVGYLVSRATGIPYLLSLRGDDVPGRQEGGLALAHRVMRPLTKVVWSRAGALVVNGVGLKERAERTLTGKQIELVPNGIDTGLFHPAEEPRKRGDKIRLLFVGRLHAQKGLAHVLHALVALEARELERVELEFVGSGPEENALKALVSTLGLAERVRFSGWVGRNDIPAHYRDSDVFVFPSYEEGMPNVVMEAMASGLPVIATDIPGVRQLVEDGSSGCLVPVADVEALRQAISTLVSDREARSRMGLKGRELACRSNWASVADRYLDLSEKMLTSTGMARKAAAQRESA